MSATVADACRRVLLVNPGNEPTGMPHYGLAMLGAVLQGRGHKVRVADYQCCPGVPPLAGVLRTFRPDVVGLSVFSALEPAAREAADAVRAWDAGVPIVCGGPHASCYGEEMVAGWPADYVVAGEAESVIADLVEQATCRELPRLVRAELPDVNALPMPDYRLFYNHQDIRFLPWVSSRGCPYHCSFCAVHLTNSKTWRPRDVASCLLEVSTLVRQLPGLQQVVIWDDNFGLDRRRARELLTGYQEAGLPVTPRPANVRADHLDAELLRLLQAVGCREIQIGVEHGHPDVFQGIGKAETLDDIRRAARLVKKAGLSLVASFIIGLPGDSVKRTLASARLAREMQVDQCYWNILVAYKGTRVYQYFQTQGTLDRSRVPKTWAPAGQEERPNVETADFTAQERLESRRLAEIFADQTPLRPHLAFVCSRAARYRLGAELLSLLACKALKRAARRPTTRIAILPARGTQRGPAQVRG